MSEKNVPKKRGRPGPPPLAKEELTKSLVETLPKLQSIQQKMNATIELIRKAQATDVSLIALEELKGCIASLSESDPKSLLKDIHKKMIARLKTKTKELE